MGADSRLRRPAEAFDYGGHVHARLDRRGRTRLRGAPREPLGSRNRAGHYRERPHCSPTGPPTGPGRRRLAGGFESRRAQRRKPRNARGFLFRDKQREHAMGNVLGNTPNDRWQSSAAFDRGRSSRTVFSSRWLQTTSLTAFRERLRWPRGGRGRTGPPLPLRRRQWRTAWSTRSGRRRLRTRRGHPSRAGCPRSLLGRSG